MMTRSEGQEPSDVQKNTKVKTSYYGENTQEKSLGEQLRSNEKKLPNVCLEKRNVISFSQTISTIVKQLLCARFCKWTVFRSVRSEGQSFCPRQAGIHLCETDSSETIHMKPTVGNHKIYLKNYVELLHTMFLEVKAIRLALGIPLFIFTNSFPSPDQ